MVFLIATDDGSFTYSAQEYNSDIDEVTFLTNYYEVPILKDDELLSHIDEMTSNGNRNIVLYDEEGEVITPSEVLSQDQIEQKSVYLKSEGNGLVSGEATVVKGEFIKVIAEPEDGSDFLGWYKDGELISTESEYRFHD